MSQKIHQFFTTIVFAILIIVLEQTPLRAQSLEAVKTIASQISVHIFGLGEPGSGVIIAKKGNTYTVLTADHVVRGIQENEEAYLVTSDNQEHDFVGRSVQPLSTEETDLALVTFESPNNYPVATLSTYTYRLYERRDYGDTGSSGLRRYNPERDRHFVFTSGWPNVEGLNSLIVNPGLLVDTTASSVSNPRSRYQSYELVYTNLTHPGMSGGPILDTMGRVIGIHGRADGRGIGAEDEIFLEFLEESKAVERIKIGHSLGVSVHTFLRLAKEKNINLPVKVENTAPPIISNIALANSWKPPISSTPDTPFYWVDLGNQLWRIGLTKEAQDNFDKALTIRRDFYLAWFAKGFVYGFSEDFTNAFSSCNRSIELNPKPNTYYDGWRCKAGALRNLGRYAESLSALNQAINAQAERLRQGDLNTFQNPSDFAERGELFFAQEQYQGALAAYDQSIGLWENYGLAVPPQTISSRGLTLLFLDRPTEALQDLQTAIDRDPDYSTGWANFGKVQQALEQYPEALAAYDRATTLSPDDPYVWNERGVLLYHMGRCPEAIDSVAKAIGADPNYAPALDNRASLAEVCQQSRTMQPNTPQNNQQNSDILF